MGNTISVTGNGQPSTISNQHVTIPRLFMPFNGRWTETSLNFYSPVVGARECQQDRSPKRKNLCRTTVSSLASRCLEYLFQLNACMACMWICIIDWAHGRIFGSNSAACWQHSHVNCGRATNALTVFDQKRGRPKDRGS